MTYLVPDAIEDFDAFLNLLENTINLALKLSTSSHFRRFNSCNSALNHFQYDRLCAFVEPQAVFVCFSFPLVRESETHPFL